MQIKVGSFALPTTPASVSVTGLPFTVTGVFMFLVERTSAGVSANAILNTGGATATAEDWATCVVAMDNQANSDTGRRRTTTRSLYAASAAGALTVTLEADTTSLNADGFTLNVTTAPSGAWQVVYVAWGDGITCEAGTVSTGTTDAATVDFTRSGFGTPQAVLALSADIASTSAADAAFAIGACDGSTQWSGSWASRDAEPNTVAGTVFRNNTLLACLNSDVPTAYSFEASFNSWITDGVRLTIDNAPAAARDVHLLMFKGGIWEAGVETQPTSNGAKTTTGLSVIPKGIITAGPGLSLAVVNTIQAYGGFYLGASDGTDQRCCSIQDVHNQATTDAGMNYDTSNNIFSLANTSATTCARASVALSGSAGEFTETWSDVDGAERPFGYLVCGDTAPGGGGFDRRRVRNQAYPTVLAA